MRYFVMLVSLTLFIALPDRITFNPHNAVLARALEE